MPDDNTPYVIKNTITEVLQELEKISKNLFMWFTVSEMMANVDKWHLLLRSVEDHKIEVNGSPVKNSRCEKLLGVRFDDQLKFDFHIKKFCKNANRKLHALARGNAYMDLSKKQILMNEVFELQFDYCPLIWICHSRRLYHKINQLHEKRLRMIYDDKMSPYEELLSKDGSASMYHKNLQNLVIGIYDVANGLCPGIMKFFRSSMGK